MLGRLQWDEQRFTFQPAHRLIGKHIQIFVFFANGSCYLTSYQLKFSFDIYQDVVGPSVKDFSLLGTATINHAVNVTCTNFQKKIC